MPSYKRPGVFVEESLTPLTQTFAAPGEAAAAFVGTVPQGPTVPTLITSWSQYLTQFGGFGTGSNYLPFAVFQYFNNGGRRCYVVRAAASDAVAASITLNDREGSPAALLKLAAKNVGAWGNSLYVDTADTGGVSGSGYFDLVVRLGGTTDDKIVERFTGISMNPTDPRYAVSILNAPDTGSQYLVATNVGTVTPWTVAETPVVQAGTPLTAGADGAAAVDLVAATETLAGVDEVLNVNLPGVSDTTIINPLVAWAEGLGNIFLVVDVPAPVSTDSASATATKYVALAQGGSALTASSAVAVYGPWLLVNDPATTVPGVTRSLPPGGAVLGQYALNDASSGVQKAPAGVKARVTGVIDVATKWVSTDLDSLNNAGVNVIRPLPGYGFCIMGARTLKTGFPDRYVSVRRSLQYIKKSLIDGTRWAVFESNNETLWDSLAASVEQFLIGLMQSGVLSGNTPDEAFYVKCDADTNPPQKVQAGEVHLEVGVALSTPAEFIVIKIGQFDGSANAVEAA